MFKSHLGHLRQPLGPLLFEGRPRGRHRGIPTLHHHLGCLERLLMASLPLALLPRIPLKISSRDTLMTRSLSRPGICVGWRSWPHRWSLQRDVLLRRCGAVPKRRFPPGNFLGSAWPSATVRPSTGSSRRKRELALRRQPPGRQHGNTSRIPSLLLRSGILLLAVPLELPRLTPELETW